MKRFCMAVVSVLLAGMVHSAQAQIFFIEDPDGDLSGGTEGPVFTVAEGVNTWIGTIGPSEGEGADPQDAFVVEVPDGLQITEVIATGPSEEETTFIEFHGERSITGLLEITFDPPLGPGTYVAIAGTESSLGPRGWQFDVTVEVAGEERSPVEMAEALIEEIEELVEDGELKHGQGHSLISKLRGVIAKIEAGQDEAACNQLGAFINQVNGFVKGKQLSEEQGGALIESALDIGIAHGCNGEPDTE